MASIPAGTTEVFLPNQIQLSSRFNLINRPQCLPQFRRSYSVKPIVCISSSNSVEGSKNSSGYLSVFESNDRSTLVKTAPVQHFERSVTKPEGLRFAVVVARSNDVVPRSSNDVVPKLLLDGAFDTLSKTYSVTKDNIDVYNVSGSSEITSTVQTLEKLGKYEEIICIGTVVRDDNGVVASEVLSDSSDSVSSTVLPQKVEVSKEVHRSDFPQDFIFGVATSAYQVEGACKEGGRGESIWDVYTRKQGNIADQTNGDIAVDQYHRYKEDVALMAKLGFGAYRFSISWPRIFPDGLGTIPNEEGIAYYNNLINTLLENGMQPIVTLYHWDLPHYLEESFGGFLSDQIVNCFAFYAKTCFSRFGDRVKYWITFNEPMNTAIKGYGTGGHAPGRKEHPFTEPYLAAHHLILAHAAAASVYNKNFKALQGGEIGIAPHCEYGAPASDKPEDVKAAARHLDFQLGWFLDPLFYGDYPESMRKRLGDRLPTFSVEDKELLKNSVDFVGLNQYTSRYIADAEISTENNFFYREEQIKRLVELPGGEVIGEPTAAEWLYIVPWGLRECLKYIADRYHNPPIFVTENGMGDENHPDALLVDLLDDQKRIAYYKGYLAGAAEAIKHEVNVKGYFAWSFMDNFEWTKGYTQRFGLVYVDYKNGLARHPKASAKWFSSFLLEGAGEGN